MKGAVRGVIFQHSATVEILSECECVVVSVHASCLCLFRCWGAFRLICTEAETRHEINSHYSIIIIELSDCFGITGVKCYKLTATRIF